MNRRKIVDYSAMYRSLDLLMADNLDDMDLYFEIGRIICDRPEKGAAVIAAEYLQAKYPDRQGFSPRNLRRMRMAYLAYADFPEEQAKAKQLGWTANVAILEGCVASEERSWYLDATLRFGWTKAQLLENIETGAWREETLDEQANICYTEVKEIKVENQTYEKDPLRVSWKYLQEPNGRVRHEGLGEKSWTDVAVPNRIGGYQQRGNWEPSLSAGTPQAGRAWDRLRRSRSPAAHQQRLREIRPADWDGQSQSAGYVPDLRRRLCRQNPSPDGFYRLSRRCRRSMVHGRFRDNLVGRAGGVPGAAGQSVSAVAQINA